MAAKERKALGAGLSALFGDLSPGGEEITTLPLSRIEPREEQPRDYFDEESLQTLADSIARYGVLQPITVRLQNSGYFQIIAGERRWRAARLAGLSNHIMSLWFLIQSRIFCLVPGSRIATTAAKIPSIVFPFALRANPFRTHFRN